MLYDSNCTKCPEKANLQSQKSLGLGGLEKTFLGEMESCCSRVVGFLLRMIKMFKSLVCLWWHSSVNILKAIELNILKSFLEASFRARIFPIS